ncbi:MAG: hypothetical protein JWM77_3604, partial [Rhodospirillales bacterium]|nr:hypothetical protein [Rhodospirillales bacterium]
NGVINIVTRDAYDTQGGLLDLRGGPDEKSVQARYGARVGDAAVRVYGMSFERGPSYLLDGGPSAADGWIGSQGGFRADWHGQNDSLTVSGDGYRTRIESDRGRTWGADLLARWTHHLAGTAGTVELQAYYDSSTRNALLTLDSERVYDVQLQHTFDLGRNRIIWGGGYRQTNDRFINNLNQFVLVPQARWFDLGNVFAQDEIKVTETLRLIGGLKVEASALTGTNYMPSVRLAWQVDERTLLWSAVSRAVRTQSRIDKDLVFPGLFGGGPDFKAEKLIAYEIGYRARPFGRFSLSATAFYHDYDDIRTTSLVTTGPAPIVFLNGLAGKTYGLESWATLDVSDQLRLRAGLTVQQARFALRPGANDLVGLQSLGDDAKNQASLRAEWRPRDDVDADLNLREVGALHRYHVPAYAEADLRVAWRPTEIVELSLVGQNLLHDRHAETMTQTTSRELGRSVIAGLRWSF